MTITADLPVCGDGRHPSPRQPACLQNLTRLSEGLQDPRPAGGTGHAACPHGRSADGRTLRQGPSCRHFV